MNDTQLTQTTVPTNKTVKQDGLMFFGNQHETVPARLLHDPCLTPRAKYAWQIIKCNAREFQGGLFPSYEVLGKMLSDRPYAGKSLSEKVITQTLYLLRLTRWLTLCETARNEKGQVLGNVYLLHDEPVPVADAIQLDEDYIGFLDKCMTHKDNTVRGVANHIVDTLFSEKTDWHASQLDAMRARYQAYQERIQQKTQKTDSVAQEKLQKTQKSILTSNMEVSDLNREVSKNSEQNLTSKMEVSSESKDNSLISGRLPFWKSVESNVQYSTLYINKYCTGTADGIDWLDLPLNGLEKNTATQMMRGLDLGVCQAVLVELQQRLKKQEVRNPAKYLYSLIKQAQQGSFNPYHFEREKNIPQAGKMNHHTATAQTTARNAPAPGRQTESEPTPKISDAERELVLKKIQEFRLNYFKR